MKKYEIIPYTEDKALTLPTEYLEALDYVGAEIVSGQYQHTKGRGFHVNLEGISYTHTETTITAYTLKFKT